MSIDWADYLRNRQQQSDSNFSERCRTSMLDPVSNTQLVDLSSFVVVEVTGEEANSFLQGQFCNDLSAVSKTHAQITGYCSPKGRLLAVAIATATDSGYRLVVPASVAEHFVRRLTMFVLRAKVTIIINPELVCTGLVIGNGGPESEVQRTVGPLPTGVMSTATDSSRQVIHWHDLMEDRQRFLVIASKSEQQRLWDSNPDLPVVGAECWRLGDVLGGIPFVWPGSQELFVPQMVNLQLIEGLSFTKGCYPGQEIVARMQYLGKLKRHMRAFRAKPNDSLDAQAMVPGAAISSNSDNEAGLIVDAVRDFNGDVYLLAVVKVSANDVQLQLAGQNLAAVDLPYSLPTLENTETA